jgi:putative transposase
MQADALCEVIVARMRAELPPYRELPATAVREVVRQNVAEGIELIGEPPDATDEQLARYAAVAAERALQGVPLGDVLRAYQLGLRELWERTRTILVDLGIGLDEALEVADGVVVRGETMTDAIAQAHMEVGLQSAREDQQRRDSFLRSVVTGVFSAQELRTAGAGFGLDASRRHVVARVEAIEGAWPHGLTHRVQLALGGRAGVVGRVDGHVVALAEVKPEALPDAIVAIGPPAALADIPASYATATRVLQTARAYGLSGVVSLSDLSIRPAILADPGLGEMFVQRYLTRLLEAGLSEAEMEETLRTWLMAGLRYEESARLLHIHVNTLRNRLKRFEEVTGTVLRDPQTVVELWWALEYRQLTSLARGAGDHSPDGS